MRESIAPLSRPDSGHAAFGYFSTSGMSQRRHRALVGREDNSEF
jgi:hypothetical protein